MNRIVFVQNIPSPYRIAFFNELSEILASRGSSLHVIYCARRESNRHWIIKDEEFLHDHTFLKGLHPRIKNMSFHFNFAIVNTVLRLRPSILVLGGSWNMPTNLLTLLFRSRLGGKKMFWSEGHADSRVSNNYLINWLRSFVYRCFDAFVVPNMRSGKWVVENLGEERPCVFLPNTVDEVFYRSDDLDEHAKERSRLNLPRDEVIFLQVSQLEMRKGVFELLNAAKHLRSKFGQGHFKVVLLGTGSLSEDLNRFVLDNDLCDTVVLAGHLDRVGVRSWLVACDWFVLNTRLDPNPLSPIEASFANKPLLLSSKAGNVTELLVDGRNGFLIDDFRSPHGALERAILLGRDGAARLGKASRSNVESRFTRNSAANDFLSQLNTIGYFV